LILFLSVLGSKACRLPASTSVLPGLRIGYLFFFLGIAGLALFALSER
jgi:hypothetical protein